MKYRFIIAFFMAFLLVGCGQQNDSVSPKTVVDYVDPYIGNISHLLVPTYPTVHLPNSMLRVYPERGDYTGDMLNGLPVAVTSHRGSSAFNLSCFQGDESGLKPVIRYSYDREKITPYDYFVYLDEAETSVYYAVSHQSGIYELTFNRADPPFLILHSREGELQWEGTALSGHQQLRNNTRIYLYMELDLPPRQVNDKTASGRNAHIVLSYPADTKQLKVRYGISFIDAEQAKSNLYREIPDFDIAAVAKEGRKIWNETLEKITVDGSSHDNKVVFYTSLYRTYERPVCISEDGRYFSAFDGKVHDDNGRPFFKKVTMELGKGKQFRIIAKNYGKENKYIQSARLNGKEWTKPWFSHDDIKEGGTLELVMGNKANRQWGSAPEDAPPSEGGKNNQ